MEMVLYLKSPKDVSQIFMSPSILLLFFFVATLACTEGNAIRRETFSLSLSKGCKRCFDKLNMTSRPDLHLPMGRFDCMTDCTEGNAIGREAVSLSLSKACKRCFDKLNM